MKNINWWTRKLHRWGALLFAIPLLLVILSGLLLQLKKHVAWIQPPTLSGSGPLARDMITLPEILTVAIGVPEAEVASWEDVDRLDIRPDKGAVKVLCNNRWELQIDLVDARLLSSTHRRSDLIESLHDGTFFGDFAKLWIFLPSGIVLFSLWLTGVWLWYFPFGVKRKRSLRAK